jgi:hypothetical protein
MREKVQFSYAAFEPQVNCTDINRSNGIDRIPTEITPAPIVSKSARQVSSELARSLPPE